MDIIAYYEMFVTETITDLSLGRIRATKFPFRSTPTPR